MEHWLHNLVTVWIDSLVLWWLSSISWVDDIVHTRKIFLLDETIFSLHKLTRTFIVLKRLYSSVLLICIIGTIRIIGSWFESAYWTFARFPLMWAWLVRISRSILVIVIVASISTDAHAWAPRCVIFVTIIAKKLALNSFLRLTKLLLSCLGKKILIGRDYCIILSVIDWYLLSYSGCFVTSSRTVLGLCLLLLLLLQNSVFDFAHLFHDLSIELHLFLKLLLQVRYTNLQLRHLFYFT